MPQPRSTTRSGSSGVGRADLALLEGVAQRGVEQPQELLDLPVLRLPAGLDPPLAGRRSRARTSTGSSLGEQPLLVAVVVAVDRDRLLDAATRAPAPSPFLVTRSCVASVVVSTCQLPNGSSSSGVAAAAPLAQRVVGGVRLRLVVRRHLQVATGPAGRRSGAPPAATGAAGPCCRPEPTARTSPSWSSSSARAPARRALSAAHRHTAATTTISSRPPSATGMTRRRWRGFTPPSLGLVQVRRPRRPRHQCSMEPRKTPARSSAVTSRGAVASSRCCWSDPATRSSTSASP